VVSVFQRATAAHGMNERASERAENDRGEQVKRQTSGRENTTGQDSVARSTELLKRWGGKLPLASDAHPRMAALLELFSSCFPSTRANMARPEARRQHR
jgi:hypothetical protein